MNDNTELLVEREDGPASGRWVIRFPGALEAEMTYRRTAPGTITIDHTWTPPELRGRNIAMTLMNRAIADTRAEGGRIVPVCSYVVAQFRRHPEWNDLLA
jgi:predicted GNAT family acetyltransferase